jgi:hypothetical protein
MDYILKVVGRNSYHLFFCFYQGWDGDEVLYRYCKPR